MIFTISRQSFNSGIKNSPYCVFSISSRYFSYLVGVKQKCFKGRPMSSSYKPIIQNDMSGATYIAVDSLECVPLVSYTRTISVRKLRVRHLFTPIRFCDGPENALLVLKGAPQEKLPKYFR